MKNPSAEVFVVGGEDDSAGAGDEFHSFYLIIAEGANAEEPFEREDSTEVDRGLRTPPSSTFIYEKWRSFWVGQGTRMMVD